MADNVDLDLALGRFITVQNGDGKNLLAGGDEKSRFNRVTNLTYAGGGSFTDVVSGADILRKTFLSEFKKTGGDMEGSLRMALDAANKDLKAKGTDAKFAFAPPEGLKTFLSVPFATPAYDAWMNLKKAATDATTLSASNASGKKKMTGVG